MTTKLTFGALLFLGVATTAFAQTGRVGINTTTPKGALDVESTNSGLVVPRVANATAVTTPVNGMQIYDIAEKCFKGYANGAWVAITTCTPVPAIFTVASPTYQGTSVIDATGIGYNGEAVPAASTITVQATTTTAGPYTLTATDAATGLVYSASGTFASAGTFPVVLTPNAVVMPALSSGVITMALTGASNSINLLPRIDVKSIPASATTVTDVTYGTQTWMDRNLGARRVATALNDVYSYGNHYQWGRPADGHEISVWNGTTHTSGRGFYDSTALEALATTDAPSHNNFILTNVTPFDWRTDNNDNRWQTASQGPCPAGYHVPTTTEWDTADTFGAWNNNADPFNSALKLPSAGNRHRIIGLLSDQGTLGYYWSSTVSGTNARFLYFYSTVASTNNNLRAHGFSVRCLRD